MSLEDHWPQIRVAFAAGIRTSLHCAIATVGADGYPHVTPIGFVFLRDDCTAFYFEEYTKRMPENLRHNPRVCLLLVNSGIWFWLVSMFRGRFASPPGIRLMGVAGERRLATQEEKNAYLSRARPFKGWKGYNLIWRDLSYVRDIRVEAFAPVAYPVMTDHLWR
jgi:uncharacterized protein